MSECYVLKQLAIQAASLYAGTPISELGPEEQEFVEDLEKLKYLLPRNLVDGLLGQVNPAKVPIPPTATLILNRAKGSISVRRNKPPSGAPVAGVVDINHVQFAEPV